MALVLKESLAAGWVACVLVWIFAIGFGYSWGPCAWILVAEVCDQRAPTLKTANGLCRYGPSVSEAKVSRLLRLPTGCVFLRVRTLRVLTAIHVFSKMNNFIGG